MTIESSGRSGAAMSDRYNESAKASKPVEWGKDSDEPLGRESSHSPPMSLNSAPNRHVHVERHNKMATAPHRTERDAHGVVAAIYCAPSSGLAREGIVLFALEHVYPER